MIEIDNEHMYNRKELADILGINYATLYYAEKTQQIPAPSFTFWKRFFYLPTERDAVISWAQLRLRCRRKKENVS